jgi:hypothetical protein
VTTTITVNSTGDTAVTVTVDNVDTAITLSPEIQIITVTEGATAVVAAVPSGGTAGQVLTKDTNSNFDASWQDPSTITVENRLSVVEYNQDEDRQVIASHESLIDILGRNARGRKDVIFFEENQTSTGNDVDSQCSFYVFSGGGGTQCSFILEAGNIPTFLAGFNASGNDVRVTTTEWTSSADDVIIGSGELKFMLHIIGSGLRDMTNIINDFAFAADDVLAARIGVSEYDIAEIRDVIAELSAQVYTSHGMLTQLEDDVTELQSRMSVAEYDIDQLRDADLQNDVIPRRLMSDLPVTFVNTATYHDLFTGLAAMNVLAGASYQFDIYIRATHGSTSTAKNLAFNGGTCTFNSINWTSYGRNLTALETVVAGGANTSFQASAVETGATIIANSTGADWQAQVSGIFTVNQSGTFMPRIRFPTADPTGSILIKTGTYCILRRLQDFNN